MWVTLVKWNAQDMASSDRVLLPIMGPLTFLDWGLCSWTTAMFEKGTSMEYLIECRSWTTTLDTFLNDNLRFCAAPRAFLTCNVLNSKGWKRFKNHRGGCLRLVLFLILCCVLHETIFKRRETREQERLKTYVGTMFQGKKQKRQNVFLYIRM